MDQQFINFTDIIRVEIYFFRHVLLRRKHVRSEIYPAEIFLSR